MRESGAKARGQGRNGLQQPFGHQQPPGLATERRYLKGTYQEKAFKRSFTEYVLDFL